MWLTEEQLQDLTKRKRPSAQIRQLAADGVPFRVVAGRPIVIAESLGREKRVKKMPTR